jgi:hypothetical protein
VDEQTTTTDLTFEVDGVVQEAVDDNHDQEMPVLPSLQGDQHSLAPPTHTTHGHHDVGHSTHSATAVNSGNIGPPWRPSMRHQLYTEQIDDIIPMNIVHSVVDSYFAQVS